MNARHIAGHARNPHRAVNALVPRQRPGKLGDVTETVVATIVRTAIVPPDPTSPLIPIPTLTLPLPVTVPNPLDPKPKPKASTSTDNAPTTVPLIPSIQSTIQAQPSPLVTTVPTTTLKPTLLPTSLKVPTTSRSTSSTDIPTTLASPASAKSSSGAVAGGVFGGLVATGLFAALILWLVRYYRRKALLRDAFDATSFRRSALLLHDPIPPPKDFSPKMTHAPAVPPASLPYGQQAHFGSDPYGQYASSAQQYNVSAYGADGQFHRPMYGHETYQYGGNLSGATYGQHASYGPPSPFVSSTPVTASPAVVARALPPPPPHHSLRPGTPQRFPPGNPAPAAVSLPNPFSDIPTAPPNPVAAAAPMAAARTSASSTGPNPFMTAPQSQTTVSHPSSISHDPPREPRALPTVPGSETASSSTNFLSRKSSASGSTSATPGHADPGPDVNYADVQRVPAGSEPGVKVARNNTGRPLSVHSMYDAADAYGGF